VATKCPKCNSENRDTLKFCLFDLTRLKRERESGRAAVPGVADSSRIPSLAVPPLTNLTP
jgi:hypothetical protein